MRTASTSTAASHSSLTSPSRSSSSTKGSEKRRHKQRDDSEQDEEEHNDDDDGDSEYEYASAAKKRRVHGSGGKNAAVATAVDVADPFAFDQGADSEDDGRVKQEPKQRMKASTPSVAAAMPLTPSRSLSSLSNTSQNKARGKAQPTASHAAAHRHNGDDDGDDDDVSEIDLTEPIRASSSSASIHAHAAVPPPIPIPIPPSTPQDNRTRKPSVNSSLPLSASSNMGSGPKKLKRVARQNADDHDDEEEEEEGEDDGESEHKNDDSDDEYVDGRASSRRSAAAARSSAAPASRRRAASSKTTNPKGKKKKYDGMELAKKISGDVSVVLSKVNSLRRSLNASDSAPLSASAASASSPSRAHPRRQLSLSDLQLDNVKGDVLLLSDDEVRAAIERVVVSCVSSILSGDGFAYSVPVRTATNQLYVPELDRIVLKDKLAERAFANLKYGRKVAITTRIMQLVYELCQKNIHVTKRDLFYCFPAEDHQLLTEHGFLFLHQVEEHFEKERELRVACMVGDQLQYIPITADRLLKTYGRHTHISMRSNDGDAADNDISADDRLVGSNFSTSRHVSLCPTSNHNMWLRVGELQSNDRDNTFLPHVADFAMHQAGTLMSKAMTDRAAVQFQAQFVEGVRPSALDPPPFVDALGLDRNNSAQRNAFLELYGYWLGAGCISSSCGSIELGPVKSCDWNHLDSLLALLPLPHLLSSSGESGYCYQQTQQNEYSPELPPVPIGEQSALPHRIYSITDPQWRAYFSQQYGCVGQNDNDKCMWPWAWSHLNKVELRALLAGLRRASGGQDEVCNKDDPECGSIITCSARFRDELQQIMLHAGYSAHWTPVNRAGVMFDAASQASKYQWRVTYTSHHQAAQPTLRVTREMESFEKDGVIWCVRVPTAERLIVFRRVEAMEKSENGTSLITAASRPIIVGNTDVKLFKEQRESDVVIEDVACMLGCTRASLNVVAAEKGIVVGQISFRDDGDLIDCTRMGVGGKAIPPSIERVTDIQSSAKFILLVEKDAAFMRLAEDRFYNQYPCIIITGKGQPDVATRLFLKKVKETLNIPVLALVDADPYGLKILSVYSSGSKTMSYDSSSLTTSDIKWLGVRPSDLDRYKIPAQCRLPLTPHDVKAGKELLEEEFIKKNPKWHKELQMMIDTGVKAEIQSLSSFGFQYLSQVFLPLKLQQGDWI